MYVLIITIFVYAGGFPAPNGVAVPTEPLRVISASTVTVSGYSSLAACNAAAKAVESVALNTRRGGDCLPLQ